MRRTRAATSVLSGVENGNEITTGKRQLNNIDELPTKRSRGKPKKEIKVEESSINFKVESKAIKIEDENLINGQSGETSKKNGKKSKSKPAKLENVKTAAASSGVENGNEITTGKRQLNNIDELPTKRSRGKPKKEIKVEESSINFKVESKAIKIEDENFINGQSGETSKKNGKKSKSKPAKLENVKTAVERIIVKKGEAAVDGLCPIAGSSHVYCDNGDIWDCMLNQTNIQFNNNKYYIIQLLKDDNKETYSVWMRWGRVGCNGQNTLKPFASNLIKAKETFMKKFCDKTCNDWEERDTFEKVPGKYDLLKMDYSASNDVVDLPEKENTSKVPLKKVESKLEASVKALIELICNVQAMEDAMTEMKYDAKKAPLGKLTNEQIKAGYLALRHIEDVIGKSGKSSNKCLVEACNAFYTRIPHYFGMKVPPLIRTKSEIQEKLILLQALGDIQAAMNIINQPLDVNVHPADQHYDGLACDIEVINRNDADYKMLENYLNMTHGKTHTMYKMELLDIYKVSKPSEESRFKDVGNRMLLWHGSRLTNWAGILSQGLRVAPPEAPSTGYMFGKGIYFADMSSKSANYCMASSLNNTGILVLCDVSLGKCNELVNANYEAHKLPKGCHSVKALGRIAPDKSSYITLSDGVVVPIGSSVETNIDNKQGYTLQYNEYVVYDLTQVKVKYLMKIKFKFN